MKKELEAAAQKILEILQISNSSLEIFLVPNKLMADINREYRGKNKATNVLSFEAARVPRPDNNFRHLGEIYLAPKYISDHNEDIRTLLIHGILHLLGYEHECVNIKKAKLMQNKEKEVAKKAGFNLKNKLIK